MKLTHYLILAAAALSFSACNSESGPVKPQFVDIVTLDSSSENGAVMSFQEVNDSPLVTLTTASSFSKDQIGKRIVVIYQYQEDQKHATSGVVDVIGAALTLGRGEAPYLAVADTLDDWQSDEIAYMQAYRSGKYLNMAMQLGTTTNPLKFACYVDENTLGNDYPELHVIFKVKPGYDGQMYNFFGSYDISSVWNLPNVKGVKLLYNGQNGTSTTIEKETTSIKPAE